MKVIETPCETTCSAAWQDDDEWSWMHEAEEPEGSDLFTVVMAYVLLLLFTGIAARIITSPAVLRALGER